MKSTTSNGAVAKTAETSTSIARAHGPFTSRGFRILEEESRRERAAALEARQAASVTISVEIDADTYGLLTTAALIHKVSVTQIVGEFLAENVCEWSNDDYALDL